MTTPVPKTIRDFLAEQGLVSRPLVFDLFNAELRAVTEKAWTSYAARSAESGMSTETIAGLSVACLDIIRCKDDEALVVKLAEFTIGKGESLSAADALQRASRLLMYFMAEPPAPAA